MKKHKIKTPSALYGRLYRQYHRQVSSHYRDLFYKELNTKTNILNVKFAIYEGIKESE